MDMTPINPRRSSPPGPVVGLVLALMAAVVVAARLATAGEPAERDVAGYAIIGHEMTHGRVLYADLWERKPPLLYATFALAERVVGYGPAEVAVVNGFAAVAVLGGVYAAAANVGGRSAGLFAAGLWAVVGTDLPAEANQPNAELLVNACLAWAVAGSTVRTPGRWQGWLVGGLFAAATMYKQNAAVACAAVGLAFAATTGRWRVVAAAGGVVGTAWAATAGYFAAVGRLGPAYDAMVRQNAAYTGGVGAALAAALAPAHLFPAAMGWAIAPGTLVVAAVVAGRIVACRQAAIVGAYAAGTAVAVAVPGHFFPHYYQLWLPVGCVVGGWAAAVLVRGGGRGSRGVRIGVVGVVLAAVAVWEASYFALGPDDWSRQKYQKVDFVAQRRLGERLRATLRPGERFWVLGPDTTIYFAAGMSPPSGLLYVEPLRDGPDAERYRERLRADLARTRPDVVVVDGLEVPALAGFGPIIDWVGRGYVAYVGPMNAPPFRLFLRRDSDVARRLGGGGPV